MGTYGVAIDECTPPKIKAKTKTLINFRYSRNFRCEANVYLIGLKGFHSIFLPHSGMRGQEILSSYRLVNGTSLNSGSINIKVEIETGDLI
ncbi:uncharacterized protein N7487_003437 [Penicillium crustosum]|uniref:uncharacterized protein n=1 Tax=Penicillium crustosum TaxID=36656 RepID=UPI002386E98A|nr:uncharacterized protein N7487_003437 [Penicillium crustosum]KAJ5419887.1 hypothetical protein N7487_003437 [Penicillium crustosum]